MNRVAAAIRAFRDPVGLVAEAGRRSDLAELTGGRRPTFVVSSPDLAREVLEEQADVFLKAAGSTGLTRVLGGGLQVSEGEHHLRERALLDPLFERERLLAYAESVNRALGRATAAWEHGRVLDVVPEMRAITTAAVLRVLFADAADADVDRLTGAISDLRMGCGTPWSRAPRGWSGRRFRGSGGSDGPGRRSTPTSRTPSGGGERTASHPRTCWRRCSRRRPGTGCPTATPATR